ncbi:pathogenesis-related protein PR-1 type-like [Cynara cardunculus var. scolymus]|uniref:pathogenesis-related protein PR-1 type-like n=1 Tax=Cynara cardunculus var. scolymus TaxID=59895 RepID=UPI000D62826C|nr:pathogenesis-related protein PR-1 type-like [Cynara cardunculus var. scolymus]
MGYSNNISLLIFVMSTAILHFSQAQNSPQDYVDAHNRARAQVGVGPMTWDSRVASFAQNYANQRQGDCQLIHSQNRPYGENLAGGSGFELTGVGAVNLWVGEKADYDYNSNTCAPGKVCGHYTQVVWRKSVRLGCARVKCNNGAWFVTCNYDPPGNYVGEKPY